MNPILSMVAVAIAALPMTSHAQAYPNHTVRIIVPYSPGGTVDLVARVLAQRLTEQMGQTFMVENRAGASGAIGSEAVARATPDGYTLLVQSPTLVANPLLIKATPYQVSRDFTPISLLGEVPMVLAAYPGVPASNLKEFVALAKATPSKYAFGTSALGSPMHIAQEAIKFESKIDIPIVAYKGTAGALNDVLGGQISALIDAIPSSYPHIESGKLKALAVTTRARVASLPNVPTVAESGLPDFDMSSWYGLWAPAGIPADVTRKLSTEVAKAMRSSQVEERLKPQGFIANGSTPQEFSGFIDKQTATYARVIKEANIRVD